MRPFGVQPKSKSMRTYAQSGQYHTNVEIGGVQCSLQPLLLMSSYMLFMVFLHIISMDVAAESGRTWTWNQTIKGRAWERKGRNENFNSDFIKYFKGNDISLILLIYTCPFFFHSVSSENSTYEISIINLINCYVCEKVPWNNPPPFLSIQPLERRKCDCFVDVKQNKHICFYSIKKMLRIFQ